jgi:hypothetical protein
LICLAQRPLATGIADCVRAVLARDLSNGELRPELARPAEVGHFQVGSADAVRVVRVGSGAARQVEPGRQLLRPLVERLICESESGLAWPGRRRPLIIPW